MRMLHSLVLKFLLGTNIEHIAINYSNFDAMLTFKFSLMHVLKFAIVCLLIISYLCLNSYSSVFFHLCLYDCYSRRLIIAVLTFIISKCLHIPSPFIPLANLCINL